MNYPLTEQQRQQMREELSRKATGMLADLDAQEAALFKDKSIDIETFALRIDAIEQARASIKAQWIVDASKI